MLQHKISQGFTMYIHKALKMSSYVVQNLIKCSSNQRLSIFSLWSRERSESKAVHNANSSFLKSLFSEIVYLNGYPHLCRHCTFSDYDDTERCSEKDEDITAEQFNKCRNFCSITVLVLDAGGTVSTCSYQPVNFNQLL